MMIKADNIRIWQTINDGDVTIAIDGVLYAMTAQEFKEMLAGYIESNPLKTLEEYMRLERMAILKKSRRGTRKATP